MTISVRIKSAWLYRYIYAIYNEGYRTFLCDMNTYIGLLAADTAIMLRESDKCPDICLVAVIPPDSHLAAIRQEWIICTVPCMTTAGEG